MSAHYFPNSGQLVVRQGPVYLMFHVGNEPGPGHEHADRSQVILGYQNRLLMFDPGGFLNPNPKTGLDHNVVSVDGAGQPFPPRPATIAWREDAVAVYATADLREVWGYWAWRHIALVKHTQPFLLIRDVLEPGDGLNHTFTARFYIVPAEVEGRMIQPGTGANDPIPASDVIDFGLRSPTDPSNWRFRAEWPDARKADVKCWPGDYAAPGNRQAVDVTGSKLVPVGRPVAVVMPDAPVPKGWSEVGTHKRTFIAVDSLSGVPWHEGETSFGEHIAHNLGYSPFGQSCDNRLMIRPGYQGVGDPTRTDAGDLTILTWPDGTEHYITWGNQDGTGFAVTLKAPTTEPAPEPAPAPEPEPTPTPTKGKGRKKGT